MKHPVYKCVVVLNKTFMGDVGVVLMAPVMRRHLDAIEEIYTSILLGLWPSHYRPVCYTGPNHFYIKPLRHICGFSPQFFPIQFSASADGYRCCISGLLDVCTAGEFLI